MNEAKDTAQSAVRAFLKVLDQIALNPPFRKGEIEGFVPVGFSDRCVYKQGNL